MAAAWSPGPAEAAEIDTQRAEMVRLIAFETALTRRMTGISAIDRRVMEVMAEVPREQFVPDPLKPYAYAPQPLPVGHEQNIAAPFLVALMTHLAGIQPDDVVFETGTGAGYHAAVLSKLAAKVYSVEVIAPLAERAAGLLAELGYENVSTKYDDGYYGWAEKAPFDAIILKESVSQVPPPLLRQLGRGGRLVAPIGPPTGPQYLTVITKRPDGRLVQRRVLEVRFSPLQGGERT